MDIKKLNRKQLLEIMLKQQQTIEMQAEIISKLEKEIDDKIIKINQTGSIAEASLALNKVFEAAQAACDQYILNVKNMSNKNEENN